MPLLRAQGTLRVGTWVGAMCKKSQQAQKEQQDSSRCPHSEGEADKRGSPVRSSLNGIEEK